MYAFGGEWGERREGCLKNSNTPLQKFSKTQASTEFWVPFCHPKYYKILQNKLGRQAGTKMCNVCIVFVKQNSEAFYRFYSLH